MEAVVIFRSLLPTIRHAEMLVDALAAGLGDRGYVEHSSRDTETRLFSRDRNEPDWIVPWPCAQIARNRRLGFIMGAEGPPTDAVPPAGDESPLRLRGLQGGELEIDDGRFRFTWTYGEDGRVRETSRGGDEVHFSAVAQALDARAGNGVEALADYLLGVDLEALGPGRLHLQAATSRLVRGNWFLVLDGLRDAMLDPRLDPRDSWIAADCYAASVVRTGASLAEAFARCREAIEIERPRPRDPGPMPTPEQLAELGIDNVFMIGNPGSGEPEIEPTPENTPIGATELKRPPDAPPPFGSWVRVLDQRGGSGFVSMLREEGGHLFAGSKALDLSADVEHLHEMMDEADLRYDRVARRDDPPWPSWLPRLTSELRMYSLEAAPGGLLRASFPGVRRSPGFSGRALSGQDLVSGIARQRFIE